MKPEIKTKLTQLLLFIFILAIPFEKRHIFGAFEQFQPISLYFSDIMFIISYIFTIYTTRNIKLKKNQFIYIWLILAIFSISYLFSPRETYNGYIWLKMLELGLLSILITKAGYLEATKKVLCLGLIVSGFLQSLVALIQFAFQKSLGLKLLGEVSISATINGIAKIDLISEKVIRAYGTFAHPNQLAAFLFVACATCLWLYYQANSKKLEKLYIFTLLFILIGEFLSFSRIGVVLTLILIVLVPLVTYLKTRTTGDMQKKLKSLKLLTAVIFGSIVFSIVLSPYISARAHQSTPLIYNRTLYNSTGIKLFLEKPILGHGPGSTYSEMEKLIEHTEPWQVQVPHNYFIIVSDETGILGLIIFISFYIYLIKKLWIKTKEKGMVGENFSFILLITFIGIIILMQFDHYFYTLQQTQLLLFLVIGMIMSEILKEEDNAQNG